MANDVRLEEACKKVFGISSRRYRQLADEGAVPPVEKGKIDILKSCKYLLEYYRRLAQGQGSMSLLDERVRLTKINVAIKEMEFKKTQGELIEADQVMQLWGKVIHAIKQKLLAVPVKLPPLVFGAKSLSFIRNKVDNFIREVLVELSSIELSDKNIGGTRPGVAGNKGNTRNVSASAKIKRKRMGGRKKNTKSRIMSRTR